MKKTFISFVMVLMMIYLVIPFTYAQTAPNQGFYINPNLTQKDKTDLTNVIQHLDPTDRKNVLYIRIDGSFVANRQSIADEFIARLKAKGQFDNNGRIKGWTGPGSTNLVATNSNKQCESGDVQILSYVHPSTSCTSVNSGPFRRVMSATGYSRLTANIYLPDKAKGEALMTPSSTSNDKGYIYPGAVTSGGEVDMGLALNYEAGPYATNETWGMFVRGQSKFEIEAYGNYKMGTTVFLKFYVPVDNQAALYVAGTAKDGTSEAVTLVVDVASSKNFRTDGVGMQVKRLVTIGQTPPEDLTTGSYIKNAHWSNVKVGTTSGSETLQTYGTFCGYPTSDVEVDFTSDSDEMDWVQAGPIN